MTPQSPASRATRDTNPPDQPRKICELGPESPFPTSRATRDMFSPTNKEDVNLHIPFTTRTSRDRHGLPVTTTQQKEDLRTLDLNLLFPTSRIARDNKTQTEVQQKDLHDIMFHTRQVDLHNKNAPTSLIVVQPEQFGALVVCTHHRKKHIVRIWCPPEQSSTNKIWCQTDVSL